MELKERHYWLGFNIFPGIGPKRFYHLLKVFGSAKKAWLASREKLQQTNIPKSLIENFLEFREKLNFSQVILRLEKGLIRFIIIEDEEYPKNLKKIESPPPLLYIKGEILPQDSLSIAVIGTRKITPYGREATEKLVAGLTAHNFTIVSGLARGVDSIAHRAALANQGRTLAVLGSGLDRIYPPENKALVEKIINLDLGAVISELPSGTAPLKGHFPSRNRLIAGLSLGVLVTEGASVSGTKITSNFCLEQKRKLLAVPGPITSSFSEGPADLIKIGAKLVTKVEDIVEEITITQPRLPAGKAGSWPSYGKSKSGGRLNKREIKLRFNNREEERIWQLLTSGGKHVDEIVREAQLSSAEVLSLLTAMELAGMVKNIGQGNYILA
jgi:DNA processing protein